MSPKQREDHLDDWNRVRSRLDGDRDMAAGMRGDELVEVPIPDQHELGTVSSLSDQQEPVVPPVHGPTTPSSRRPAIL